jgi:hypothetical protein
MLLTRGKITLIDDEDWDLVKDYKWYAHNVGDNKNYYAARVSSRKEGKKIIYLHRLIMGALPGQEVDHINRMSLDNRKENLRLCTHSTNQQNQDKVFGKSKFTGVCWSKSSKKWQVSLRCNNERFYLGVFDDEIEAAKSYNKKALELYGEFAKINLF